MSNKNPNVKTVVVHTLNPEAKKKCDALGKEKREEMLELIDSLEKKWKKQLEKTAILKAYFDVDIDEKDVHGCGPTKQKGNKKSKKRSNKKRELYRQFGEVT